MDCPGPLATTAADAALAFAVMAGEEDRTAGEEAAGARGITVGVPRRGFFTERIHPDVRSAMAHVEGTLGRAGATPADTAVEGIEDAPEVWLFLCYPEFVDAYPDLDPDALLPETRFVYEFGRQVTRGDREAAMARGEEIREVFLAALADVDALLLPATPFAAPRADEDEVSIGDGETVDVYRGGPAWFTRPISISRLPSLSVPAGFDERGLPLGVQLVGRPDDEWTLLRLGKAFQAVTDHHLPAPPLPGGGGAD